MVRRMADRLLEAVRGLWLARPEHESSVEKIATTDEAEPYSQQHTTTVHLRNHEPCPSYLIKQREEQSSQADATITSSDGVSLRAHRCVLAGSSDYCGRLFESGLADSTGTIALDMPSGTILAVLAFIYEGDCPTDEDSLVPLLEAAIFLQVKSLEFVLMSEMIGRLTPACALDVLELARNRSLTELEAAVWMLLPGLLEVNCVALLHGPAYGRLPPTDTAKLLQLAEPFLTFQISVLEMPKGTWQAPSTKRNKEKLVRELVEPLAPPGFVFECNASGCQCSVTLTIPPELAWSTASGNVATLYEAIKQPRHRHAFVQPGFPQPLHWDGLTLEHYRLGVDRGISFARALALYDESRGSDKGVGFYKSRRCLRHTDIHAFALLVPTNFFESILWEKNPEALPYQIIRPETGRGAWGTTVEEFTEGGRFFQLSPNEAKSGWEERYHAALTFCLHGPACEKAGCTLGKRVVEYLDLLSGPCLPFWPQLKIDGLRVEQSHFIKAHIKGEIAELEINGLQVDGRKLAELVAARSAHEFGE